MSKKGSNILLHIDRICPSFDFCIWYNLWVYIPSGRILRPDTSKRLSTSWGVIRLRVFERARNPSSRKNSSRFSGSIMPQRRVTRRFWERKKSRYWIIGTESSNFFVSSENCPKVHSSTMVFCSVSRSSIKFLILTFQIVVHGYNPASPTLPSPKR